MSAVRPWAVWLEAVVGFGGDGARDQPDDGRGLRQARIGTPAVFAAATSALSVVASVAPQRIASSR